MWSRGPEFKSSSMQLDGFVGVGPRFNSSTIASWSAFHQLQLLTTFLFNLQQLFCLLVSVSLISIADQSSSCTVNRTQANWMSVTHDQTKLNQSSIIEPNQTHPKIIGQSNKIQLLISELLMCCKSGVENQEQVFQGASSF